MEMETIGNPPVVEELEPVFNNGRITEERDPRRQRDFDIVYMFNDCKRPTMRKRFVKFVKNITPLSVLTALFPIICWLPNYKCRADLFYDIVSGVTVAVIHIPQGLAYSILAGIPPIVGIYMAFYPVIIYTLMGTSRHVSMGTFALICIMAGKSVAIHAGVGSPYSPIQVVSALSLVTGMWQCIFGVCRLGSICVILSEHLISGLVTGAAIVVITFQLKYVIGVDVPRHIGPLKVVYTLSDVTEKLSDTNLIALGITLVVLFLSLFYNEYLKERICRKLTIPIPTELIIIVCCTLLSKWYDLPAQFHLTTVGNIPVGFPAPAVPPIEILYDLAVDGFVIGIISFSITISMAKIFAKKHKYNVDPNQELIAAGCANMFGSFFSCAPFCASLSRSMIQDLAGGRTQLASAVSCLFLSIVIVYIGPFFEPLPHCVLAGIILAAMKGMLWNLADFPKAWVESKTDGLIWLVTFLAVVVIDIDIGLCIGALFSLLHLTILGQRVKVLEMGHVRNTDVYVAIDRYLSAVKIPGVLILHVVAGMNFANKDSVRDGIYKKIEKNNVPISHVILDMSGVAYMDPSSIRCLIGVYEDLKKKNVALVLAKCHSEVVRLFYRCKFFDVFTENQLFLTVHDAVGFSRAGSNQASAS